MDASQQEGTKLGYDAFKHLTTLSTGSILLLVTMLEKLFQHPHLKICIAISFVGFIWATMEALAIMFFMGDRIYNKGNGFMEKYAIFGIFSCISAFSVGIISLVFFVLVNIYA